MNIYGFMRNLYYWQSIYTDLHQKHIKSYKLIINNNTKFSIYLSSLRTLIIDLALISSNFSLFQI